MPANLAYWDRWIRFNISLIFLSFLLTDIVQPPFSGVLIIAIAYFTVTCALAFSPLYSLLGISTYGSQK